MKILKKAQAGTLESGDVLVTVKPSDTLMIEIESPVARQFGDAMERSARDVLESMGIYEGAVHLADQGALDCTLRARLHTAIHRALQDYDADVAGSL
ncbi:MAG: citrate lyase acyl carrier protein [Clostridiaceae bacterium]|nr:citrate lyase acyl carrier protein [Clostridiaceae bacterium]